MRLHTNITPQTEIDNSKLVTVHITAPHVVCPRCGLRNVLTKEFWHTVTELGYNDVPGCCPECRTLYTIHVIEKRIVDRVPNVELVPLPF